MTTEEREKLCKDFLRLKKYADRFESVKKRLKKDVGTKDSLIVGVYEIENHMHQRSSIDSKKLKQDGLYSKYSKDIPVRQLKVKIKGRGKKSI